MRVLMIVQLVDEREWLRGFTVAWIRALAAQVERLHILTLEYRPTDLPANVQVYSMGKEHGYSRPRELALFYRHLWRIVPEVDVIFSHMTPRYTWLAAPVAALHHKPQMLWFTHRKDSRELRLALACARWITTAAPDSFPIASPKVHVMGHGIDTNRFAPNTYTPLESPPLVLAVGRMTPIKHHHILLEAAALLRDQYGIAGRFAIAGQPAAPGDEDYQARLLAQRAELGFAEDEFALLGGLETDALIDRYRRASLVTNLSPAGLFDKAALEAMLTATPVLVASPAFDGLLGEHAALLRVPSPDDMPAIARQMAALLSLSAAERAAMGADLRERTAAAHGLERLMQNLVALMQSH